IANTLNLPIYFGVVSLIFSTLSIVLLYLFIFKTIKYQESVIPAQAGIQRISLDSRFPFDSTQGKHGNDKINYFVSFFAALLFGNLFIVRMHTVIPE
ncbi:hypothetical protein CO083_03000, partial [Candidatus Roizmanbacteria bacterium CG_4_9_14_0_8_um_filter_34_12]